MQAGGQQRVGEVALKVMWEQRGSEAGIPPAVPLVEVGVRGARGEGGGNEKGKRMRQEMEGQREVQEFLVLVKSQVEELEGMTDKEIQFSQIQGF